MAFTACQMESQVPQGLSPVDLSSAPDASPRLSCVVLDDTQADHLLFPGQTDKFLISDYYFPDFSFPKSPPIKKPTNSSRPISNVTFVKNSSLIPTPYIVSILWTPMTFYSTFKTVIIFLLDVWALCTYTFYCRYLMRFENRSYSFFLILWIIWSSKVLTMIELSKYLINWMNFQGSCT